MKVMNGPHKYVFSQFELNFMRAHFHSVTNPRLAQMLGHTLTLVRTECYKMGLKRMELEYWTGEQIKFLNDNYRAYGDSELAEIFEVKWHKDKGWTKKHIEKKRRYLNLKRTESEKTAIRERNIAMGRFALCPVHAWETRGTFRVGTLRLWSSSNHQFLAIKLKQGYVHYAPWLYQQIYGPIPKGYMVRTKDDNPLNVKPGNLELITRSEHATRNSKNRMPKEYRELKILSNQLTKTINERTNRKEATEHAQ